MPFRRKFRLNFIYGKGGFPACCSAREMEKKNLHFYAEKSLKNTPKWAGDHKVCACLDTSGGLQLTGRLTPPVTLGASRLGRRDRHTPNPTDPTYRSFKRKAKLPR